MEYSPGTKERSIFLKILSGQVDGVVLLTSERFFAILTNKPSQPGHTLIMPKRCGIQYGEFSSEEINEFGLIKQLVMRALQSVYVTPENGLRIGEHVSGFEIKNHYHVHLIPAIQGSQISLQGAQEVSLDDRISEGNKIRDSLRRLATEYSQVENLTVINN